MFWQLFPIILIVAIVVILFLLEYRKGIVMYFSGLLSQLKGTFSRFALRIYMWRKRISIEPPQEPTSPSEPSNGDSEDRIHLTTDQVRRLFNEVLPSYYKTANYGTIKISATIGAAGTWYIDSTILKISTEKIKVDVAIDVDNVSTFNEIISKREFEQSYVLSLYMSNRVRVTGNLLRLKEFIPVLQLILDHKDEILEELYEESND